MIMRCESDADFENIQGLSKKRPVFLLKHSTRCPISAAARIEFEQFSANTDNADFWQVLVVEDRSLSLQISSISGIEHKSPQVLVFAGGKAVLSCSHREISVDNLTQMLNKSTTQ